MKWAYIYALINGYEFYYKYNDSPVFPNGSIEHYYKSINTITDDDLQNRLHIEYNPHNIDFNLDVRGHYIPEGYKNAQEFHSNILKKIYCPNDNIMQIINNNDLVKKLHICRYENYDVNEKIKYIALHIRLGDKVNGPAKETNIIPLDKYFEKCIEIKQKYRLKTIVICSDTTDGLDELIKMNNNEFEILFNDEERSKNVWNESIVQRVIMGYNDKPKLEIEYINCFINYEILLNAEVIV